MSVKDIWRDPDARVTVALALLNVTFGLSIIAFPSFAFNGKLFADLGMNGVVAYGGGQAVWGLIVLGRRLIMGRVVDTWIAGGGMFVHMLIFIVDHTIFAYFGPSTPLVWLYVTTLILARRA